MYKFAKKVANHEGFTLVELIVVIAILGILAGIAIPVYSGYIKKANQAADNMLLSAVNTAFAAACQEITNGVKPKNAKLLTSDDPDNLCISGIEIIEMADTDEPTPATLIPAAFATYFAGNTTTPLKYYKNDGDIEYKDGRFVGTGSGSTSTTASGWTVTDNGTSLTYTKGDTSITVDKSDIENIKNSTFGQAGMMGTLMDNVDTLSSSGANIFASRPTDLYTKMGTEFQSFITNTLGKTAEDVQNMSSKDLMNAVMLFTMDQSQGLSASDIMASVLDETSTGFAAQTGAGIRDIKLKKDYTNSATTVRNVAMAYAMVLGFTKANPDIKMGEGDDAPTAAQFFEDYTNQIKAESSSGTNALIKVMTMLSEANNSDAFKAYLRGTDENGNLGDGTNSQGLTDLQGYISAMTAGGTNVSNINTEDLLTNGLGNSELSSLLTDIFG